MRDRPRRRWALATTSLLLSVGILTTLAKGLEVNHQPRQPKSGQSVLITAKSMAGTPPGDLILQYQIVDPGNYISRRDSQFGKNWLTVRMNDAGENGDKTRGDGILTAELPASLQTHRRLMRYRIVSARDNKMVAPEPDDTQPNYAYFVYDGVPAWKGAINPASPDPKLREVVTYGSECLQQIPVYHFISHKSSVENVTWNDPKPWGLSQVRNDYHYTGTMVYDGIVYDHVPFRARGGEWRHAIGKNMWKFNFFSGHRLEARDNHGKQYDVKWDKLNLGTCIQQGDSGLRGEQGMIEALGFRLFNLAGIEAPLTHWVHLRIIDAPEESPRDQYSGDFWGLYLATENIDGHFLKEHRLPKGNLYKIDSGRPKTEFIGNPAITNQSDVLQFMQVLQRPQPEPWWPQNVDLPRYYSYRSILECVHHYDIQSGKNYFYYFNPASQKWIVLPWDIDLSWSDAVYGSGQEPFYRAGVLLRPPFKEQYQDRLAEIRDLLFNPEQLNMLIDEYAGIISAPAGTPSIVAADRAKWDFNPVLASPGVLPKKAGQGRFYFGDPSNNFGTMVGYMKDYAAKRLNWIDGNLLAGHQSPASPKIAATAPLSLPQDSLKFRLDSNPESLVGTPCRWRLAEITDPKSPPFKPGQPRKYEIDSIWEKQLPAGQVVEVPADLLVPGHVYRVRARRQDASGRWSRWSGPLQFTAERK